MQQTTFADAMREHRDALQAHHVIDFDLELPAHEVLLPARAYGRFPYVPSDAPRKRERCEETVAIRRAHAGPGAPLD